MPPEQYRFHERPVMERPTFPAIPRPPVFSLPFMTAMPSHMHSYPYSAMLFQMPGQITQQFAPAFCPYALTMQRGPMQGTQFPVGQTENTPHAGSSTK